MDEEKKYQKLRTEAEERLKTFSELRDHPSLGEVKSLMHELRVYQIELEMQNQELREAQNLLEESRDQYADLFEFAPVGYFVLDRSGVILNCNLTGCGMLGIERTLLIGKPFVFFVAQRALGINTFRTFLKNVFTGNDLGFCDIQLKGKDKVEFFARLDTLLIKDEEGQDSQCRMAVTDITKEKNEENLKTLVEAVLHGQESERERIAAELHDSINPLLSIAGLNIESIVGKYAADKDFPSEKLNETLSILENAIRGIKEISQNLSPALLKSFGLSKALEQLCKRVKLTDRLNVECHTHGLENRLDLSIELALYRISQELMNNILKHSSATEVDIQLVRHQDSVVLMVSDDGVGFNFPQAKLKTNGFGFKNIISRAHSLKGLVNIDTSKNEGTTVTVELPI